ncbi:MAG: DUF4288 domain-containing protein [Sphingobacteriales bacterium]|nr:MAG: DUF4288 domain-containing protein [Sphingobacteriales bacterium]
MKWFTAKICFHIHISGHGSQAQFDEQIRLISAATDAEAYQKALDFGQKEEESFTNSRRQSVHWKLLGITDLKEITELADGAELFSEITEPADSDYFRQAETRSRMVRERTTKPASSFFG